MAEGLVLQAQEILIGAWAPHPGMARSRSNRVRTADTAMTDYYVRAAMRTHRRRAIPRPVAYGTAFIMLVAVFFLHFLLERRQDRLVARHIGKPLLGAPLSPAPGASPEAPLRVWIDTDAGCGEGKRVDVDDCFALAVALFAPEFTIAGISTTYGNVPLASVDSVTRDLLSVVGAAGRPAPGVYRGAAGPGTSLTAGSEALAHALGQGPLTVLALGPLTNVAAVLQARPDLASSLVQVIFVGGKRSGQWMHPGYDHFLTFSDFNVAKDLGAAERVLAAGIPVALIPFEAALEVAITPTDLGQLSVTGEIGQWLVDRSREWIRLWRRGVGREGFVPFDNASVLYAIDPPLLECVPVQAELERSPPWFGIGRPWELVVRDAPSRSASLRYCHRANNAFASVLRERLLRLGQRPQHDTTAARTPP